MEETKIETLGITEEEGEPIVRRRSSGGLAKDEAYKVLMSRLPRGVHRLEADQEMVEKAQIHGIIFPWMRGYKIWWSITVIGAIFTIFLCPFQIAFEEEPGTCSVGTVELVLTLIFLIDMGINFNLSFYKQDLIVFDRKHIFLEYFKCMFWVDLLGVFPFETVALLTVGHLGKTDEKALLFSLLRLFRFARLHRLQRVSYVLQYNARISLLWYTLIRNFAVTLALTHAEACCVYFLARYHNFDEDTWLGPLMDGESVCERYIMSLYWSMTIFATVGYGDYAPKNSSDQVFGIIFMLLNIVVAACIIGSITLLIVKNNEKSREYRDSLESLHQYGTMHEFDKPFMSKLDTQLRLEFNNREIADEKVLKNFPSAARRQILRRLYLQSLTKSRLMNGVRPQFIDAFLASCKVEIFSPGEQLIEQGSILSDLFLLVGGIVEVDAPFSSRLGPLRDSSMLDSDDGIDETSCTKLEAGDFVGEVSFFTESAQTEAVSCLTVCKTLTMSRSTYRMLTDDHLGSAGKILQNLLEKVEELGVRTRLSTSLEEIRAGSCYDLEFGYGTLNDSSAGTRRSQHDSYTAVKDLVKMHMSRQLDDQTMKLLFAASRGDTSTISLMCNQGFDPNNTDYDNRTALHVASMKGNTDAVKILLDYKADPNATDMHGSTAMLEAVKNGHDDTMELLSTYGADLCMDESIAAAILCQTVYEGDICLLKRLLKANIPVNSTDYDRRTAAHIAAAEGNVAAIRILAEYGGADLTLKDRWDNTVHHEADRANAKRMLRYLNRYNT